MSDRSARRLNALRPLLDREGVPWLLIASETNVGYLTGFTGDSSVLLVSHDRALLVSDGRYTTQLARECPDLEVHIRPVGQPMTRGLIGILGGLGTTALGIESTVSVGDHEELTRGLPALSMKVVRGGVEALRSIKDEEEIAAIRRSVEIAERAFAMFRAGLRLDETEKQATDLIEGYLRRCGAGGSSFPPIVAAGANAARPHHRGADDARIGDADFVLVDWGASGPPYKSDLTRVLVTGKVTSKFEEVYRAVLSAQERGIAAIRPGAKGRDVDAEARSAIEESGFGSFFTHGLGHGIGRDIHEAPRLHKDSEVVLEAGMVITVEPGIYLPDWGGVRIEDDVLVTPDGHEILSHVPKSFDTVCP